MGNRALAFVSIAATLACQPEERYPGAYQGVVEHEEVHIAFEAGGRLTSVSVHRGDALEVGAPVARLDDTLARTAQEARQQELEATEAQLALLRAGSRPEDVRAVRAQIAAVRAQEVLLRKNLERERRLMAQGASTKSVVDELATKLESTVAERTALGERLSALEHGARPEEIEGAEARTRVASTAVHAEAERLARYSLTAPVKGTVLDVHVETGEIVSPGAPVATLVDTSRPFADVFVPQGDVGGLKAGETAKIYVDASPDPFAAKVETIFPKTEFTPRYLFSERERPNLVVRVRLRIEDPKRRLVAGIPAFAYVDGNGGAK
jgi:HlyD family secretion protein